MAKLISTRLYLSSLALSWHSIADFFKLAHIPVGGGIYLLNGFGRKILIFGNKVFNDYGIKRQYLQSAENIGMFTGQIGSDLGQACKDHRYVCINDSFKIWPDPPIQVIGLIDYNKKARQAANFFQIPGGVPMGCPPS
jgi:hypothetical protein